MTSHSDRYFATDYQDARGRFLDAAERAGAAIEHWRLPGHDGPDGRPLYMDIARLGPIDADTVLVSLSGTHGAEGFCGSAAQVCWLDNNGSGFRPPKGVALLFVHAVNPFGFAHMVRNNENNVDLNRNFIDFEGPAPANPLAEDLHDRLPDRDGVDEDLVEAWAGVFEGFWAEHGDWVASDAASRGQYSRPDGIHFGGLGLQWSSRTLAARIREHCGQARHVVYIDWHTLIRTGDGELVFLCFNQSDDPLFKRVGDWWSPQAIDRSHVDKQWGEGAARSARRPSRNGLVMWGLQKTLAPNADLAGAVIEFCADADHLHTDLRARVRHLLRERWLIRTRDYDSPTGRFLAANLREDSCPTRKGFQEKALDRAMDTYASALQGAAAWSAEGAPAMPGLIVTSQAFDGSAAPQTPATGAPAVGGSRE